MKCPRCGSTDTKKVRITDPDWRSGGQRCKSCGHVDAWGRFCEPPMPEIVALEPGLVQVD